jgi:flagellar hook assembly protein FlgD
LPKSGNVQLRIYNLLGELVCEPVHEFLPAGEHRFSWDGKDSAGRPTPTGVYLYKLTTKDYIETKKMILLK